MAHPRGAPFSFLATAEVLAQRLHGVSPTPAAHPREPSNLGKKRTCNDALLLKLASLGSAAALTAHLSLAFAQTPEPIKVGILHSLSGTMAISETNITARSEERRVGKEGRGRGAREDRA